MESTVILGFMASVKSFKYNSTAREEEVRVSSTVPTSEGSAGYRCHAQPSGLLTLGDTIRSAELDPLTSTHRYPWRHGQTGKQHELA